MAVKSGKLLALLMLAVGAAPAAELNPQTVKVWNEYVASVRARTEARARPTACFLWVDENADRLQRLHRGEIVVAPGGQTPLHIPGGLIHHWMGAVFIPDVTLAQVLETVQDYDRYKDYYPSVIRSTLTSRIGQEDRFSTLERHQALFSRIALDADFGATYTNAGPKRGYTFSRSTRLQQIQNYGEAHQREMEPGASKAYMWRLDTISRYEERDGGVYLELEAMALSRDIPVALRWLVEPFVRDAAAGAMAASLKQTRQAVLERSKGPMRPVTAVPAGAAALRAQ